MNNIFVGNLSFEATREDVIKLFSTFGTVANATIMERKKGKSRGYGFVDMPNEEEKNAAILGLEGKEFMWRVLSVSPVVPKAPGEFKKKKFKAIKEKEFEPTKPWVRGERTDKRDSSRGPTKPWIKEEEYSKPYRRDERDSRGPAKPFSPSKPWVKKEGGASKPFRRDDHESKPWIKKEGASKSWGKSSGGSKPPYKKFEGEVKPWVKKAEGSKPWIKKDGDSKPYRRDERDSRGPSSKPWVNREGGSKPPYKKFEGEAKPWVKKDGDSKPKGSAFKSSGGAFKVFHKAPGAAKAWPKKGQSRS